LLPGLLRGDLDTIVLKCLAEEPELRYASAGALADDVQRHLAGRPVDAHPPSRWYRARKFLRRHRASVSVSAALALAIVIALAVALWQADVARREAVRAREVQSFVESLFRPLQEKTTPDKTPTVLELLQRGLARVDSSFRDDESAQADLLAMFARINDSIGAVKDNLDLSERAWRINARVYGANDLRTLDARELHARVLSDLNRDDDAMAEFTAVRTALETAGIHGATHARVIDDMSVVRMDQGASDEEIIAAKKDALRERELDPAVTPGDLSAGYNNLGNAYDRASRWDDALHWYRKAYETDLAARGESIDTAIGLGNIGGILYWSGRWRESVATLEHARAMFAHIAATDHPNLVSLLIRLCDEQAQLEMLDQASATCADAVAMAARVLGESHTTYAMALMRRSGVEIASGNFDAATADLAHAREIYAAGQSNPAGALRIAAMAQATMDHTRGDYSGLREHLAKFLGHAADAKSPSAPRTFAWFALACAKSPGSECADDQTARAQAILDDPEFSQSPNQLPGRTAIAQIALMHGDAATAVKQLEQGLAVATKELGEHHSWVGEAHLVLGDARAASGDAAAAKMEYATAVDILRTLPATHPLRLRADDRFSATK
jgi:serine/threonine-protein kinase